MIQKFILAALTTVFAMLFGKANATYEYRTGQGNGLAAYRGPGCYAPQRRIKFADIAAQRTALGLTALAQNDVLKIIHIPAFVFVHLVTVQVITAEGEAVTVGVGDSAAAAGFMATFDLNTVGVGSSAATAANSVAVGGGKFYAAADAIQLTLNTNITYDTADFVVTAIMFETRVTETYGKN